jgi:hypothetical protein
MLADSSKLCPDYVIQNCYKPDVWLQLVERCAADRESQPMALRSLALQLAEQRDRDAEQSARVNRQQCQLWDLEEVVAEQGARIAVLEGQLQTAVAAREQEMLSKLEHQQVVAEQGARIAVLEGQLQNALAAREQQPLLHQQGAAEQVVAEQGARIAVLEGQLQALLQRFPPV